MEPVENDQTCWTLIRDAAGGAREARTLFAQRYLPVVKAYLGARWRRSPLLGEIDDAVQEFFVDCFRPGGVLERALPGGGGFRAFLFGVARTVALHFETRRAREAERRGESTVEPDGIVSDEESLSRVFDRAWARAVMREARELQQARARLEGEAALRRVELLRLRFEEGMPVRDIAALWSDDADRVHREYAHARREFRDALATIVRQHGNGVPTGVEAECARLIELLR